MPDSVAAGASGVEVALDFGTLALEHGATAEAIRWLQMAVARAPDRAEAHEKLGLAIFLQGDPRTAVPHLERARQPRSRERQRPPQSRRALRRTREVCRGPEPCRRDGASPRPRRAARGGPPQSPPEVTHRSQTSADSIVETAHSRRVPLYHLGRRLLGLEPESLSERCFVMTSTAASTGSGRRVEGGICHEAHYAIRGTPARRTDGERAFRRGADHGQQPARLREG